jgi:nucleotide-binding universal stress UspA family protein
MLALDDLLLARDFSSVSDRALRHALDLAARTGAALHLLHVEVLHEAEGANQKRSPADGLDAIRDELKQAPRAAPADALDAVAVHEATERDISAGPAILNYAAEHGIDLIALGTHGRRGPKRVLLGSVAEEVVRRANVPVLTVRGGEDTAILQVGEVDRVLVPIDFSDPSREALRHARAVADLYDARLDLLYVIEEALPPAFYVGGVSSIYDVEPDIENKARAHLQRFVNKTPGPDVDVDIHVMPGQAASGILSFAEENDIDLVTTSTHGRTGLDRFLLGSVAEKLVRHLRCPVLTVKAFGTSLVADAE